MDKVLVLVVVLVAMLLSVGNGSIQTAPTKDNVKVVLLQEEGGDEQLPTTTVPPEETKEEEEEEELEEEEEWDYELGKVDPQTKKATRYVCQDCGEVQLEPFKCEICEKDAVKEELDVEERKGKWFIKGTNTQVVEKEPEEEEWEEEEEEKEEEKKEKPEEEKEEKSSGGGKPSVGY